MIPVHHIRRAIHAFYAEVTERSLQLALRYPGHRIFAEKTVRKSNERLAHYIGLLKSTNWTSDNQDTLQQLCSHAEEDSIRFLGELQHEVKKAEEERRAATE